VSLNGETVTLICALNEDWRIMRIADRPGCGPPFWSVERKIAGDWIGQATFRTPGMILWFLEGRAGTIDADAAAILAGLPARCDQDPAYPKPPRYQTKRPRPPREKRPAVVRPVVVRTKPWLALGCSEATYYRRKAAAKKSAAENAVMMATPAKQPELTGKRAALASQFLQWRDGKPAHALAGPQPSQAPPAEMARWARRAAPGNVDTETV
jgi:hypothetical protein